ncbi:hypothetical protein HYN59_07030 [Flavobacterium album]|uniref:Carboxypeptidase regulatory-like domain-containing protein n=1 Tax=Flavobacterium album TaxID=2175091 RepID=A0A2S1QXC9_9FLAO|nr:hypothetical protein [Flavobacterium album]AWH84891.1 hypothetical protein HYN59_07030 [Flavobacterium album]
MANRLLYLFFLFTAIAFAQDRQLLKGKVTIGDAVVSGIFVINNKTGEETKTDSQGSFSIMAKTGDALAVYSDKTEIREFAVNANTFKESPYIVSVNYKAYELKEVEIDKYKNINSEKLGIVPKGQKQYTVAERRLKTAGEFRPIMLLGIIAGGMPIDPIINAISGRTKMLKGALATERKEMLMEKINNIYDEQAIRNELHIPQEYVDGFVFYAVEDKDFAAAIKANNNDQAKFLLAGLAQKYLKLINAE